MPRRVAELPLEGQLPFWRHPEWAELFPWLVQGTTGRGSVADPFDLGLSGRAPVGAVLGRWRALGRAVEMPRVIHARQTHGAELALHEGDGAPGLLLTEGVDGHLTRAPGVLLTVSVADCVPLSLVDAERRAVALLHAGWRGAAGGILEAGIARMRAEFGSNPGDLWLHCGPAICGECYEVGPEVHRALRPDRPAPAAPEPVDLRAVIVERATATGLSAERITVSAHCTRCGGAFFSHRGGSPARQIGVLGIRAGSDPASA